MASTQTHTRNQFTLRTTKRGSNTRDFSNGRYAAHHSHIVMMVLAITGRAAALMAALLVLSWLLPAMFSSIALVGKVAEALCHCVWIAPWK